MSTMTNNTTKVEALQRIIGEQFPNPPEEWIVPDDHGSSGSIMRLETELLLNFNMEKEIVVDEYEAIWDGYQWLDVRICNESFKNSNAPRKMMRIQHKMYKAPVLVIDVEELKYIGASPYCLGFKKREKTEADRAKEKPLTERHSNPICDPWDDANYNDIMRQSYTPPF